VIEGRCLARRTGSVWQRETVAGLQASGRSRPEATTEMLRRYLELMHSGDPVHTWAVHR